MKIEKVGEREDEESADMRLLFSSHHPVSFKSAFSASNEAPDAIHRVRWFPFALFFVPSRPKDTTREEKGKKEKETRGPNQTLQCSRE